MEEDDLFDFEEESRRFTEIVNEIRERRIKAERRRKFIRIFFPILVVMGMSIAILFLLL
nr:hypothetical protein [Methanothermus fervidus]